jgi:hypothetical protein
MQAVKGTWWVAMQYRCVGFVAAFIMVVDRDNSDPSMVSGQGVISVNSHFIGSDI